MEIEYEFDPVDVEALNVFVHRGTVVGWALRRPWVFVGVFVVILGAFLFRPASPGLSVAPAGLIFGVFLFSWSRRHRESRKKGAATFSRVTLTTSAEGLQVAGAGRSSSITWPAIRGYGETDTHLFLMIDAL